MGKSRDVLEKKAVKVNGSVFCDLFLCFEFFRELPRNSANGWGEKETREKHKKPAAGGETSKRLEIERVNSLLEGKGLRREGS
jgi:hypothetical protein